VTSASGKVTAIAGTASYKEGSKTRTVSVSVQCTRGRCSATIKDGDGTSPRTFTGTGVVTLLRDGEVIGAFLGKAGPFGFGYAPPKPAPKPKR
jgi:hypothetical protein